MSTSKQIVQWNIVRKGANGLYYLETVLIEPNDSGAAVFTRIQKLCYFSRDTLKHKASSIFYSPVVYTVAAVKGHELTDDIEAQTSLCEVFVKSQRYNEAYTLALRDPVRFERQDNPNFTINRSQLATSGRPGQTIHALLVVQEIRHAKVVLLFGAVAVLSVGIGVMAGHFSKDVNMGVGVTAALFQFLTMLQWSYIWVTRG